MTVPNKLLAGLAATVTVCAIVVTTLLLTAGSGIATVAQASVRPHSSKGTRGLELVTVMSGGRPRTYLLYVPPGDSVKHRLPLVLVYHGADDTASATVTETGLLTVALQRRNMIVAFLQGYQDTWNDDAGNPPAEAANINDVGFTTTALRRIESNWYVDMGRVVATGFSNGAIFAELLGCRSAAYLTAIVPVEGQIATTFSSGCRPQMPISVYEIHATADQSIPYDGGTFQGVGGPVSVMSAPASAALWAKLDKCAARPLRSVSGSSVLSTYQRCSGGVSVTLNSIQGGSHEWPPGFGTMLDGIVSSLGDKRQASKP